ncbi:hypothetical protein Tco_0227424 [Tanacetum coccineum]
MPKSLWGSRIKSRFREDINQKFLRSVPSSWNQIALIMRNKPGIDEIDIDDLYNNHKVYEDEMKSTVEPMEILELVLLEELVKFHLLPMCHECSITFSLHNLNTSSQLKNEYFQQIDEDDLEKLDLFDGIFFARLIEEFGFALHRDRIAIVLGQMTYLVASSTLDSARSHVMQGASFTQGTVSSIPIGGNISPEGFLPSILLLVVIIVTVVVVVIVILIVVVVDDVSLILKISFVIIGFLHRIMLYYLIH